MSVVLSEHLPLLASAPNGIQKLRGLILELAVRGKLVPQDPNDEPASELLKRIAKERARLVTESICKPMKATSPVVEDQQPFTLPYGWEWVRLSEIGHDWGQKTPDEEFSYIDVSAIDNTRGKIVSPSVVAPRDAPSRARKLVRSGTVIYSTVRPYLLNIAVVDRELSPPPIASTAFAIIHPLSGISSQFIFWYLRSPVFVRYVESVQTGIAYPAINDSQFFSGFFPLPPLAEQHRIVAKVDELMALCDRLEQEVGAGGTAHTKLVETLLGTLTQCTDAADLAANWQRLAEHFNTLFTTEDSLDALKQTVLQLAVMGKLVPQDPNDEPASELLKRIAKERAKLEAEGKIKKSKPLPPVGKDESPFALPNGWEWTRLEGVIKVSSGDGLTSECMVKTGGIPVFGGNGVTGYHDLSNTNRPTLVIGRVGFYCGSIHLTPANAWITDNALRVTFSEANVSISFLYWLLRATNLKENESATAQPLVTGRKIYPVVVGIPPLAEQHRIVAKVDELMALCDRLKADLAESRTRQDRLATTLIETALMAA